MPHPPPGQPLRVLVVDDNRDAADSAAELLRVVGFEPLACYGGAEALEASAAFRPNVCLVDLNMPGMDGDEVARRLRALPGGGPPLLVAVTALGDADSRRRTEAAGFCLHLVKPVDPHDLLRVLDELARVTAGAQATRDEHVTCPEGRPG